MRDAGLEERPGRGRITEAAPHQHLGEHVGTAQLGGQARGLGERVGGDLDARPRGSSAAVRRPLGRSRVP